MGGRNLWIRMPGCALALVAAALLSGCLGGGDDAADQPRADTAPGSSGVRIVQPGAPGEASREVSADEAAPDETAHTPDDVDFMQGMIHHHAQALVMTELAAERASGKVALMAERIDISQKSELELMEQWLDARDEPIPDAEDHAHEHGPEGKLMPGMVGAGELRRLAAAGDEAFDALFVRYMIRHHAGAITMVGDLRSTAGGGAEPELDAFARHVQADQDIEISRLETLGAKLPPPGAAAGDAKDFTGRPPALCILA